MLHPLMPWPQSPFALAAERGRGPWTWPQSPLRIASQSGFAQIPARVPLCPAHHNHLPSSAPRSSSVPSLNKSPKSLEHPSPSPTLTPCPPTCPLSHPSLTCATLSTTQSPPRHNRLGGPETPLGSILGHFPPPCPFHQRCHEAVGNHYHQHHHHQSTLHQHQALHHHHGTLHHQQALHRQHHPENQGDSNHHPLPSVESSHHPNSNIIQAV